jgi:ribosome biogenesis protein SSF1/2
LNSVKKSEEDIAALKAAHAAKERLRKERREEQERNVQRKKAQADGGAKDQEIRSHASENESWDEDEGEWDEDEDISEGEEGDMEVSNGESEEHPPLKKARRTKR